MKAYELKIALRGQAPEVWRRVLVPEELTFSQLALVFNLAMGWEKETAFSFLLPHKKMIITELSEGQEHIVGIHPLLAAGIQDDHPVRMHNGSHCEKSFDRLVKVYVQRHAGRCHDKLGARFERNPDPFSEPFHGDEVALFKLPAHEVDQSVLGVRQDIDAKVNPQKPCRFKHVLMDGIALKASGNGAGAHQ